MRQRFNFEVNNKKNILTLSESGEIEPDSFLTAYKEEYDLKKIKKAIKQGQETFIEILRTRNFFPYSSLAVKLFESLEKFFKDGKKNQLSVDYDDIESLYSLENIQEEKEDIKVDDLLNEENEDISGIDTDKDNLNLKINKNVDDKS
ncbi:MAG: hypothetical protein B6I26_05060 [Desulfobacteraceae bacterium 4572_130]|nr:MAG: hypothetical protein B6I26_05060 [Desulfobacteraceae bacterium 4572_130]